MSEDTLSDDVKISTWLEQRRRNVEMFSVGTKVRDLGWYEPLAPFTVQEIDPLDFSQPVTIGTPFEGYWTDFDSLEVVG